MILIDANLLVYSSVSSSIQHEPAKRWLDDRLNGAAPVGMPWSSLLGFLRLVTNPRIFDPPVPSDAAWKVVEYWLDSEPVWIPRPTDHHRSVLGKLYGLTAPSGNLVPDAHLAALAIEHGLILCSTDRDFARFPELRWENPLDL